METRRAAAELFTSGLSRAETARRLGLSRATATRWYRLWQQGGALALSTPRSRGPRPKLDAADLAAVQRALDASPRDSGFALERWSLAAIVVLIQRSTGVLYHPRHVVRVLRRSGWVVPPVGEFAPYAFRQLEHLDPDGNVLFLRRAVP